MMGCRKFHICNICKVHSEASVSWVCLYLACKSSKHASISYENWVVAAMLEPVCHFSIGFLLGCRSHIVSKSLLLTFLTYSSHFIWPDSFNHWDIKAKEEPLLTGFFLSASIFTPRVKVSGL